MQTETITTHQIQQGDVIWTHGLRLLVDSEPQQSTAHGYGTEEGQGYCYWVAALVTNWAEVENQVDPLLASFIREDMRPSKVYPEGRYSEPRWVIQGNGWAHWAREVN